MKTQRILKYDAIEYGAKDNTYEVVEDLKKRLAVVGNTNKKLPSKLDINDQSDHDSADSENAVPNIAELEETVAETERLLIENKKCFQVGLLGNTRTFK